MAIAMPNLLPLMGLNPSGDIGPFTVFRTRRRGIVWFPRSPPLEPPSYLQRRQRNRWQFAARSWSASTASTKANWNDLARIARLNISGYNLFIYYNVTWDAAAIRTLQHNTGITVL